MGLLVPPRDVDSLRDAIATLADDAALSAQLGHNGREWVTSHYSLEKYTDRVEQAYREILA